MNTPTPTPTPTPRTDAATALTSQHRHDDSFGDPDFGWVTAGFARTLERELAALTGTYTCTHHNDRQRAACAVCLVTALTAERDELRAQLHALNLVCGTTDADKFQTWVDRANARAERAETELATERARLDYLSTRGFEHRHHETGDHLGYEWTISSYSESEDVTLRDVIDAEMREDEK